MFGTNGDGWLRMNLATKKDVVVEACRRIGGLIDEYIEKEKMEKL
jgi:bifunctional pyridoxal-dependent enzyme with beta-cystathionase and maltose regulon repressor activities